MYYIVSDESSVELAADGRLDEAVVLLYGELDDEGESLASLIEAVRADYDSSVVWQVPKDGSSLKWDRAKLLAMVD
jgi:hypothetical protein